MGKSVIWRLAVLPQPRQKPHRPRLESTLSNWVALARPAPLNLVWQGQPFLLSKTLLRVTVYSAGRASRSLFLTRDSSRLALGSFETRMGTALRAFLGFSAPLCSPPN